MSFILVAKPTDHTLITITRVNIVELVKGGRAIWKIENEAFNTLSDGADHFSLLQAHITEKKHPPKTAGWGGLDIDFKTNFLQS